MTSVPLTGRPQPALRPIALPTEHGGWGFLFEPIVLALLLAPSWSGVLVGLSFILGFLVRQPLRFALQDALRGRSYPRTPYCWMFATGYGVAAGAVLAIAVAREGLPILIPLGLVAPLALTQILYDSANRSRALLPELSGAAAMSSSAAAIAIAGGMRIVPAFVLSGIIIARSLPSIVYVRTLLARAHRKAAAAWPAMALHGAAALAVAATGRWGAVAAMTLLLFRAAWGLSHPPPAAKTIGWRELFFGAAVVGLVAFV